MNIFVHDRRIGRVPSSAASASLYRYCTNSSTTTKLFDSVWYYDHKFLFSHSSLHPRNHQHRSKHDSASTTRSNNNDDDGDRNFSSTSTSTTANKVNRGYWKDLNNQRLFFSDKLARTLGIERHPEDWYKVSANQVMEHGGRTILRHYYDGSLYKALATIYPETDWRRELFVHEQGKKKKSGFWKDSSKHREFFDNLARQLDINQPEDWYRVSVNQIAERGGRTLMRSYYENSLYKALNAVYPEIDWQLDQFERKPHGFWSDLKRQREFMDQIARELGISRQPDDWYRTSANQIVERGGYTLMRQYYNNSLYEALSAIYPEYEWDRDRFAHQQQQQRKHHSGNQTIAYWKDLKNQRRFFDDLATKLGIKRVPEDWYEVTPSQIKENGGTRLLYHYYNGSLYSALAAVYPEVAWQAHRFESRYTVEEVVHAISRALYIEQLDDWYRVSLNQLRSIPGHHHILKSGGLLQVLRQMYPNHAWDEKRFVQATKKKSAQRLLLKVIQDLFPNTEIIEDYEGPLLQFNESKQPMQLDIYLPALQLAFEYQGEQHFREVSLFGDLAERTRMDEEKLQACRSAGITLIRVPYWWDHKAVSLVATIREERPELLPMMVAKKAPSEKRDGHPTTTTTTTSSASHTVATAPIPLHPPTPSSPSPPHQHEISVRDSKDTPGGFHKSELMLATNWNQEIDPTGWWMSEKLDGIRAYWDGQKLYSRTGRQITAPSYFTNALPKGQALDGELWIGREQFMPPSVIYDAHSRVWESVKYCAFDVPAIGVPYEERLATLQNLLSPLLRSSGVAPHILVVPVQRCTSAEHMHAYLKEVVDGGGEGLIMRKPQSRYQPGRTNAVLKLKPRQDTEVKFVERHPSHLALICDQPDGQRVPIPCSSRMYYNPPSPGSLITVTHAGFFKNGTLRHAFCLRERRDIEWSDVVEQFNNNK